MKVEIRKIPAVLDALGDYYEQRWDWQLRADNGHVIAESTGLYRARYDAIGAVLRVMGLALPVRPKGVVNLFRREVPMPRGGAADVYVDYGSGGQVKYAQWTTLMELIELVER